jgi:hypothetical protein
LVLALGTAGVVSVSSNLHSTGQIKTTAGINVYSDSACTQPLTSLDWGEATPGGTVTKTIYLKNSGTSTLTLNMQPTNWNPSNANGPLSVSWDKNSATVASGQSTLATLKLSVSSSVTGISTFSVDVTISGTA